MAFECKNCPKRYIGCHDKCESYLSEKERLAKIKKMNDNNTYYNYNSFYEYRQDKDIRLTKIQKRR